MSLRPNFEEQRLLAAPIRRADWRLPSRERLCEALVGLAFGVAAAGTWWVEPPHGLVLFSALLCVAVMALAERVRFDTPFGFAVATELAFVPLLFAVPLAIVPVAVVAAYVLARLPRVLTGSARPGRLVLAVGDSWFALGPVAVFAVAGTQPRHAGAGLLIVALLAQFAVDFAVTRLRFSVEQGAGWSVQLRQSWVYAVDAALAVIGLVVAQCMHVTPLAAFAPLPLLGLLAMFAHERRGRLDSLLELNSAYRGTALVLGDVVEADDGYTGMHSRGVLELALAVAEELGLSAERSRNLEFAALLHDVGKIAIPKKIINKPGKLDPHEWTVIKTHTLEGQKLLNQVGGFMRDVGLIVRSHHERWDGRGYPDGLADKQIPLEARIIACCDTWSAMRTDRPYRPALAHDVALAELLASAGSQLDPRIVSILTRVVEPSQQGAGLAHRPAASLSPVSVARSGDPERVVSENAPSEPAQPAVADRHPAPTMGASAVEDARASDPVERLLEDSWQTRGRRASRRELTSETAAALVFLGAAGALAAPVLAHPRFELGLTALLVGLYAVLARAVKFPLGAGYVVPSYLVLAPMLVLLPPAVVPLCAAAGLFLGTLGRLLARQAKLEELLFAVPDASHTLGPALVLTVTGTAHGLALAVTYLAAFLAGCVADLASSSLRESFALGVAPRLQLRVLALVWLIDAGIAPVGLVLGLSARHQHAALLAVLPLSAVMFLLDRERKRRFLQAQERLDMVARERTRLQAAVGRLGEAFAAKLDLPAISRIALRGAIDALDADCGQLLLQLAQRPGLVYTEGDPSHGPLLHAAAQVARTNHRAHQLERDGAYALTLPLAPGDESQLAAGTLTVARRDREFRADEQALLAELAAHAHTAVCEILANQAIREQAVTDALTGLGNRRRLTDDLARALQRSTPNRPALLLVFDLNGFKAYNDTFGHLAGDQLLTRLGDKLSAAVAGAGTAYRLGGDEFCALLDLDQAEVERLIEHTNAALSETGEEFAIRASLGAVLLPHEADSPEHALQLADQRMYTHKRSRADGYPDHTRDVLIRTMHVKQPDLDQHSSQVAEFARRVARHLGLTGEDLDEIARAAELHDVGKVGIPDAILNKPGSLDPGEWEFMHQHTILGERILNAAPALRPVARLVRASHERWDGTGYPDRLAGPDIPLGARIIAACDAYQAMTTDRPYHKALTPQAARDQLQANAGGQFDPAVVDALLATIESGQPQSDDDSTRAAIDTAAHIRALLQRSAPPPRQPGNCSDPVPPSKTHRPASAPRP